MATVTNDMFLLAITLMLNLLTLYQKNKTAGSILTIIMGIYSFLFIESSSGQGIGLIIVTIGIGCLIYDWLGKKNPHVT